MTIADVGKHRVRSPARADAGNAERAGLVARGLGVFAGGDAVHGFTFNGPTIRRRAKNDGIDSFWRLTIERTLA